MKKQTTDHYYKCLGKKIFREGEYTFEAVQPGHIEKIRQWRNEQIDVLRQSNLISKKEQDKYYKKYVWPEMVKHNPETVLLSLKYDKELLGYGGLVNISWENLRGEISFLLNTRIANTQKDYGELFPLFLNNIKNIAFNELSLFRIYGELYDIRPKYSKVFENEGFILEGVLRCHVRMKGVTTNSLVYGILKTD